MTAPAYYCPACGSLVPATESDDRVLQCAQCGQRFFVPDRFPEQQVRESDDFAESEFGPLAAMPDDAELSELRIRQLANLRRGAYRSRSWLLIGAAACLVAGIKLLLMCVVPARHGMRLASIGDAMGAVAALMLCRHFVRRARALTGEIASSRLADPVAPPDLSTLSDGSQRWRNLEQIASDDRPAPRGEERNSQA